MNIEQELFTKQSSIWLPPPKLTISQWSDRERRLSSEASAEPGVWRTSRAEYQRGIMDAISDAQSERIILMTAAQIGKTELLLNVIGYYVDQQPSPILVINPTVEMGESFSTDRLAPMIRDTPCLTRKFGDPKSRNSQNTKKYKKFPGGQITIAGANSPSSLASRPIRILLCDEVDRYPVSAGSEGDPVALATKRTQNFWNRKILLISSPALRETSKIAPAYEASSREEWTVPCPECGGMNAYEWEQIIFREVREPLMKCKYCGCEFPELKWKAGQSRGQWQADNPEQRRIRGFHLNAFASPWAHWDDLIAQYQSAVRLHSLELEQVFVNTVLGLPYEHNTTGLEVESMDAHREDYHAELPDGVLVLTCGIDTQDDRLECEVVGWGLGKESWGIEYRVFHGNPVLPDIWRNLEEFLSRTWHYANGDGLKISCSFIDSAGHFTDEVYKFCKPRKFMNIFPIVGRGREGMDVINRPSRTNRLHVMLFTVGVSTVKGELFNRLQIETPGAGYCHFPNERGYGESYFAGLLSERMVIRRRSGRQVVTWEVKSKGLRNEPLDCRVYASAALELLAPDLVKLHDKRMKELRETRELKPELQVQPVKRKVIKRGFIFRKGMS